MLAPDRPGASHPPPWDALHSCRAAKPAPGRCRSAQRISRQVAEPLGLHWHVGRVGSPLSTAEAFRLIYWVAATTLGGQLQGVAADLSRSVSQWEGKFVRKIISTTAALALAISATACKKHDANPAEAVNESANAAASAGDAAAAADNAAKAAQEAAGSGNAAQAQAAGDMAANAGAAAETAGDAAQKAGEKAKDAAH